MKTAPVPRFRSHYNYVPMESDYEKTLGISLTIPDDTFSLHELIERFGRGHPINVLSPVYNEHELADIRTLDLVDIHDYLSVFQGEVFDLKTQVERDRVTALAVQREQEAAARAATEPVPPSDK